MHGNITQTKRNLSSSSSSPSSSPKAVKNKSKIFVTPNRYAALSEDPASSIEVFSPPPVKVIPSTPDEVVVNLTSAEESPPHAVTRKSPPIFIKDIANLKELKGNLIPIVGTEGFTLTAYKDFLKITTPNCEHHLSILNYLVESDLSFHTFAPRHTRPIVAFIRYLHHSTPPDDITTSLESLGFSVLSVSNVVNRTSNLPMSLFTVRLENTESNKKIFSLTKLLHSKVIVEKPKLRNNRYHPQCKRCQSYGHTFRYCAHTPRCVKCGQDHLSEDCSKSHDLPAKCALCSGAHTANFKGCPSSKHFKLSHNKMSPPGSNKNHIRKNFTKNSDAPENHDVPRTKSYSEAATTKKSPLENMSNIIAQFIANLNTLIGPLMSLLTEVLHNRFSP